MDKISVLLDDKFERLLDDIYQAFEILAENELAKETRQSIRWDAWEKINELEFTYFKRAGNLRTD